LTAPECKCSDGFYEEIFEDGTVNDMCRPCLHKCALCSNNTGCDKCAEGRINEPECICPDGTFDDGYVC